MTFGNNDGWPPNSAVKMIYGSAGQHIAWKPMFDDAF